MQEKKRNEALDRLVPAAANLIGHWWRFRCYSHGNRYVSTWKIYKLTQRRITVRSNEILEHKHSTERFRRKSISKIDDIPRRYLHAIKMIRIIKYHAALNKFRQAKRPVDLREVLTENNLLKHRLSLMLNDVHRRLDLISGSTKSPVFYSEEQKRSLSLAGRIEKLESNVDRFQEKIFYLNDLVEKIKSL